MDVLPLSILWLHPMLMFAFQILTIGIVIAFTSPSSLIRPAAIPIVGLFSYAIVLASYEHLRLVWASLLSGISLSFVLNYIDLSLLSRWSYETHAPPFKESRPKSLKAQDDRLRRLHFGLASAISFRHVNTPYEVKNVPPFTRETSKVPSKAALLRKLSLMSLACFLVMDIIETQPRAEDSEEAFSWQRVRLISRLNDITSSELRLRVASTSAFWFNMFCMLQGGAAVLGFIAVGANVSDKDSWRPLFDSPLEAYTLRRFWG